jgi:molybdate transport system substrate-binding protein
MEKEISMELKKKALAIIAAAGIAAGAAGCSTSTETEKEEEPTIMIAAAASLETVLTEKILPAFTEETGIPVEGVYDASGKLATQIENGLEAEVFLSAGVKQMSQLEDEGLIETDSVVDLLENKVVLIKTAGSDTDVSWETLTDLQSFAIGNPDSVPAGQYAKEILENLGIYEELLPITSLGSNVTEVLNWVAYGSAQAGIVYSTDAVSTDKVEIIAANPEGTLASPVIYPAGIVANNAHPEQAKKLLEFLQSDTAAKYFEEAGFTVVE